jgi:hypothetical protein
MKVPLKHRVPGYDRAAAIFGQRAMLQRDAQTDHRAAANGAIRFVERFVEFVRLFFAPRLPLGLPLVYAQTDAGRR